MSNGNYFVYKILNPIRDEIVRSLRLLIDLSDIPEPSFVTEMVMKELRERLHVITISRKDRGIGTYVCNNGIYVEGGDVLERLFRDVLRGLELQQGSTGIARISDFERILESSTLTNADFKSTLVIYGDWPSTGGPSSTKTDPPFPLPRDSSRPQSPLEAGSGYTGEGSCGGLRFFLQ